PQKHVWRARIVLATADGLGTVEIMRTASVSKTAVWRWQARFMEAGVEGLLRDKTRPARVPKLPEEIAERIVALTLGEPPGETTLFAAFDVLEGKVIGRCMQRHRHQEFIRFLNAVERQVPAGKTIHAILDNYATHKHPKVIEWLGRHPRWTFHFTPTSASWLNAVEGFFATLARRRLKRGVFRSVADLQAAINRFVEETNSDPKPFVWTADPKRVLAAVKRATER